MSQECLELISALSQAAATLIAVLLAFLLSILSDHNSWNHRKKEQIREHQIDSLKTIVSCMQKVDLKLSGIIEAKKNAGNKCSTTVSQAMIENIKLETNDYIIKIIREIGSLEEDIWQEYWELRLLKYNLDMSGKITDYIGTLSSKLRIIEESMSVVDDPQITDSFFNDIRDKFENYIKEAENGLTK